MAAETRIAFITGANRGLGLEAARQLGRLGITVLLGSRDLAAGQSAGTRLRDEGVRHVEAVAFDVNDRGHHAWLAAMLQERYGRLDILINNAGIVRDACDFTSPDGFNTVADVPEAALRETFETNFFSIVALTRTLLPLVRAAPAGRIVNLSSSLSSLTMQTDPASPIYRSKAFAYDASKTALNAFTVHLAALLRDTPIKVNACDPGWVKTDMGGPGAQLELREGGKTSVRLATLPADGPTGGFFHLEDVRPW